MGVDLYDDPEYRGWQKKIERWNQDMQESNKFQILGKDDGWDFEKELRIAREKNRLAEEEEEQEEKKDGPK